VTSILFDLDGTLVDSAPGILGTLRAAFAELGVPEPAGGLGVDMLGPPLHSWLPPLVGGADADRIVPVYRRIYAEHGIHEHRPFAGIDALLRDLAAAGVALAVATSKLERFAERIVAANGWTSLFRAVCGETADKTRPTKAHVVAHALERLGDPAPAEAVMVGDRSYDVVGARANGLACLGVGWGYAEPGELDGAGAETVCADVDALRAELTTRIGSSR
jgi:phosphoglycolate phosphatase